jgi:hypothetical protein
MTILRTSAVLLSSTVLLIAACSSGAVGVDACRRVEEIRCQRALSCKVDLSRPPHDPVNPEADVAACARHYQEACQHGIVAAKEPSVQEVDVCVKALRDGPCTSIVAPETDKACVFLAVTADASAPAPVPAADAAAD